VFHIGTKAIQSGIVRFTCYSSSHGLPESWQTLSGEYEVAMKEMDDASPQFDDSNLTDRALRVIAARKAWIEHRQTCVFCKTTFELRKL
jgi:hypothetical protein